MLIHPDLNKIFQAETNASKVVIGGVVFQEKEPGQWHPIGYYSRASLSERGSSYPRIIIGLSNPRHTCAF